MSKVDVDIRLESEQNLMSSVHSRIDVKQFPSNRFSVMPQI
jgi:hypothetical protein